MQQIQKISFSYFFCWANVAHFQIFLNARFEQASCQSVGARYALHFYNFIPPVSLTPVVHLDLRISPRIFEKIRNDPNVIFRGLGEGDS